MLVHLQEHSEPFPAAACKGRRSLVESIARHQRKIEWIAEALHDAYGTSRLGNQEEPVDELVYIILSRKTREEAYQDAFRRLTGAFESWDGLLAAPAEKVLDLIYPSGLSQKKTLSIRRALEALREEFGGCTMEPARRWSDERLFDFLCSLPELGPKSAYCIMLYSFGRDVFPVDTHVGRCLSRISPLAELGLDLRGLGHKKLQQILPPLIPPDLRYGLHVNFVAHGRSLCRFERPLCQECPVRPHCAYGKGVVPWDSTKPGSSDGP